MALFSGKPPRRRRVVFLPRLAVGLAAALIVWVGGLFWFAAQIPQDVADPDAGTDAIAVLTGAGGRLATGLELLEGRRAEKLFVSGAYRGVDVATLLEVSQRSPEELTCCIEIGHSADNTAGNAAETAAWMRRQGYSSVRIVTSNYHMPRSLLEFRHALPDAVLVPHPVFHDFVKMERWWAWPGTAGLVFREYNKFLFAWAGLVAADVVGAVLGS